MIERTHFEKNFDYGSILPLMIFMLGIYVIFLFANQNFSLGIFIMMIAFIFYAANNIILNLKGFSTVFNEYLEDMATFLTFGFSTILFGFLFYSSDPFILAIIVFYSICLVLALARNWILRVKNSLGWPIPLNGLFFPLVYYIYDFYLHSPGNSIFLIFYIGIAFLSISHFNFLGYKENTEEEFDVVDSKSYKKDNKEYEQIELSLNEKKQEEMSQRLDKLISNLKTKKES